MTGPALATIKVRLTLSSKDVNMHKVTIASHAEVVNHLFTRYATDEVVAKADEEIRIFKQGSWRPWDLS